MAKRIIINTLDLVLNELNDAGFKATEGDKESIMVAQTTPADVLKVLHTLSKNAAWNVKATKTGNVCIINVNEINN